MKQSSAVIALTALAHDTRLGIFRLLVGAGSEGLAAGTIAARLRLPAPNLSFHLSHLSNAGLVMWRRQGRSIFYAANFDSMNRLLSYLTDNCCGGHPELCVGRPALAAGKSPNRLARPATRLKAGSSGRSRA